MSGLLSGAQRTRSPGRPAAGSLRAESCVEGWLFKEGVEKGLGGCSGSKQGGPAGASGDTVDRPWPLEGADLGGAQTP